VKLVDEHAVAGVGVLRDFVDERLMIETVNLIKLVAGIRPFENILANSQHSWSTSAVC
jgi:hypothetical protein